MRFLWLFFPLFLFGASFITQMEYASMLYKNPRGIGCHKCHGEKGEGLLIAKYHDTKRIKDKDGVKKVLIPKEFRAPAIAKLSYERFKSALQTKQKGMPRYYLTNEEIKALYFYLQQINLEDSHE